MPTDQELIERIDREMLKQGIDTAELVRRAKDSGVTLDAGTVGDMLAGKRIPRRSTLGKIIGLLGIDLDENEPTGPTPADTFESVVLADPTLIDEAKEHLIRQYDLLQRASIATPTNVAAMPIAAKRGEGKGREIRRQQDVEGEAPDVS